ncbi:MAG TPA: hypothetical protein VFT74_01485 [Isosphaeraceae bacterium]|nr:hypothetical protein [Isosphaeraceae bacterium]
MKTESWILALLIPLLVGACDITSPEEAFGDQEIGIVEWVAEVVDAPELDVVAADSAVERYVEWDVITAPAEVAVGDTFMITVTTYVPTSCWTADEVDLKVEGLEARIVPYDRTPGSKISCPDKEVKLSRKVPLSFDEPGDALIVALGRRVIGAEMEPSTEAGRFETGIKVLVLEN